MPRQQPGPYLRRERDRRVFRRQLLLLAGCLLLAAGFIIAARQQIVAVQYGYRTEALRREREKLMEEQRHLRLALEENSSPAQLERAARELGMQPTRATQIEARFETQERAAAGDASPARLAENAKGTDAKRREATATTLRR